MGGTNNHPAVHVLRVAVAVMMIIHGAARWHAGAVAPFGVAFESWGFPFGMAWAWAVTVIEILGGAVLATRRCVVPLCAWFVVQLCGGIVLVHARSGWFVVGLGRNGVEFSVLLIVCFACVAWLHWPARVGTESVTDE